MNGNGAGGHFGSFVRRRCRRVAFSVQVVRRDETWNQNDCGKQPVHDIFVRVKVMLNIPARRRGGGVRVREQRMQRSAE